MINVIIADDHELVRRGVEQVLAFDPGLNVVAGAKNAWEVVKCVSELAANVLLLDMTMPGPSGIELIRRVKASAPHVQVLVLSMHADPQVANHAIRAGASGYLTKDSDAEVLIEAIRQVHAGANYIEPDLATRMVFNVRSPDAPPHTLLSNREYQVFVALVQGRSLAEIAEQMYVSAKTISTHKFRLMQKLGISTVSELVRYALQHGVAG